MLNYDNYKQACPLSLASACRLAAAYGLNMADIKLINPEGSAVLPSTWVKALCDAAAFGYTIPGVPDYMLFDDLVIRGVDVYGTCSEIPPLACRPEEGDALFLDDDIDLDDDINLGFTP